MKLSFVELRVSDWPRSVAWYRDVLGLTVLMSDSEKFALLGADEGRVALKAGEPRLGVLLAFEVTQLDDWVCRLGDLIEGPVKTSDEGYRRVRFRDPDGYEIILFEWRKGTP